MVLLMHSSIVIARRRLRGRLNRLQVVQLVAGTTAVLVLVLVFVATAVVVLLFVLPLLLVMVVVVVVVRRYGRQGSETGCVRFRR